MEENCSKCLICSCDVISPGKNNVSRSSGSGETSKYFSTSISKPNLLDHHLDVIFVLRNILELPVHQLMRQLRNNWDIQDWISLCENCNELVAQCREIHNDLVKISIKFKSCQLGIVKIVKASCGNGGTKEVERQLHVVDEDATNVNFVEEIHNFVLKNAYTHLVDPFEKTWPFQNEVKRETTQSDDEEFAVADEVIKTEPDSECEDDNKEPNFADESNVETVDIPYNENSMEASPDCETGKESEQEEEWQPENAENINGSEDEEPGCSGGSGDDQENDSDTKIERPKRPYRRRRRAKLAEGEKTFLCPVCQAYKKPIENESSALLICRHLDNCIKKYALKNNIDESEISELKCTFCSKYSCSTNDIASFANHLVSCTYESSPPLLRERTFQCDLCPDKKDRKKRFFTLDGFLAHCSYHQLKKFKCADCEEHFSTTEQFRFHWARAHRDLYSSTLVDSNSRVLKVDSASCPTVPWWCPACDDMFNNEAARDHHLQSAHPLNSVSARGKEPCQFCEKVYYCPDELKLHQATAHTLESAQLLRCDHCTEVFVKKADLSLHRRRYHKLDLLKCVTCNKEFVTGPSYWAHQRIHQKVEEEDVTTEHGSIKCHLCDKEYATKKYFRTHMAYAHEKTVTISCQVCGMNFARNNSLLRHLSNIHKVGPRPGEKELTCPVEGCGKVYRYRRNFRDHIATHEKKTVYPCAFCGKEFYVEYSLKMHERLVHDESSKQFQCEECPYTTTFQCYLNIHHQKHHSAEAATRKGKLNYLFCEICSQRFLCSKRLEKHKRHKHTGRAKRTARPPKEKVANTDKKTDVASDKNKKDNGMGRSQKNAEKAFMCQICGGAFASENGLKIHQENTLRCKQLHMSKDEATVVCHLCGGRYRNKYQVANHIRHKHERKFKFNCEHCPKGFISSDFYKRHLAAAHKTGEYYENKERFRCPEEGCGKILFRASSHRRHKIHHKELKGQQEFKCEQCEKAFSSADYLYQHVRLVHQGHRYTYKKKPKKSQNMVDNINSNSNENEGTIDSGNLDVNIN